MNKRPTKPVIIAPKPVVPKAGIFGFALKRTKYNPSDIAVNNPQLFQIQHFRLVHLKPHLDQ